MCTSASGSLYLSCFFYRFCRRCCCFFFLVRVWPLLTAQDNIRHIVALLPAAQTCETDRVTPKSRKRAREGCSLTLARVTSVAHLANKQAKALVSPLPSFCSPSAILRRTRTRGYCRRDHGTHAQAHYTVAQTTMKKTPESASCSWFIVLLPPSPRGAGVALTTAKAGKGKTTAEKQHDTLRHTRPHTHGEYKKKTKRVGRQAVFNGRRREKK